MKFGQGGKKYLLTHVVLRLSNRIIHWWRLSYELFVFSNISRMAKTKKSLVAEKTADEAVNEVIKKTPKPRGRSKSRTDIKARKSSKARSKSRSRKAEPKAKAKSRSRSRSRSRTKSPKRRGRPRSQKNTTESRGRPRSRSRSRKKIDTAALNELISSVEQKRPNLVYKDVLHDDFTAKESKLNEIIRRSISRELSQEKMANTYRVPSHTSSLKDLKEVEPKNLDGMSKDPMASYPRKSQSFSFSIPSWFRAIFGLTVPPLTVLLLHLACNRFQCTVSKFHIPRNWKYYLNPEAFEILTGFIFVQAILSLLPIGKRVEGPAGANGILLYRCNGLLCTFLTIGIAAGLWHFKFPVTIVYDKLISLLVASIIIAYLFGLILFIKGGRAPVPALNPAGIVGSRLHQFYVGRELNPLIFRKVNVKTLLIRTCLNGMLLMNGLMALKAYEAKQEISYTLGTCVVLNALLVADFFWFENTFPLTYEAMYEGTGCSLTLGYFLYPFMPALVTKYIIQHKVELPVWSYVAIAIGFIIGFVIYRASNLQKAAFRKCPLDPALKQYEALSTNRGKKLLVVGWWGWVRHPNYLGTILLHWAWASTAGFSHVIPYSVPLLVTILLMYRARRVDSFCSQRYQSAWGVYCSRVPHRIFPHVY